MEPRTKTKIFKMFSEGVEPVPSKLSLLASNKMQKLTNIRASSQKPWAIWRPKPLDRFAKQASSPRHEKVNSTTRAELTEKNQCLRG